MKLKLWKVIFYTLYQSLNNNKSEFILCRKPTVNFSQNTKSTKIQLAGKASSLFHAVTVVSHERVPEQAVKGGRVNSLSRSCPKLLLLVHLPLEKESLPAA